MGPAGMRSVAELCLQKAHYAAERLAAVPALPLAFDRPDVQGVRRPRQGPAGGRADREMPPEEKIFAGVPLGRWYPQLDDCLLVAVTEKRTKTEIDRLASVCA